MNREYIYIPTRTREEQAEDPRYKPIPLKRKPSEVWRLVLGLGNPNFEHRPDMPLIHGRTAIYEDEGHDWRFIDGFLFYSPGGERDGGLWIVSVYE